MKVIEVHTTTGLRLLRALEEHGESVPAYLEPVEGKSQTRAASERRRRDKSALETTAVRAAR